MMHDAEKFLCNDVMSANLLPNDFIELFRHAVSVGSFSDIYIRIGQPVIVRSEGTNYQLSLKKRLSTDEVKSFVSYMYDDGVWSDARSGKEFVSAFEFPADRNDDRLKTTVRMRVIVAREQGMVDPKGVVIVLRKIENVIPTLDTLNVKQIIRDHAFPRQGLVIVAGETGSGKSTLLAAIIHHILTYKGDDRPDAVISELSDPIEFLYHNVDKGRNIITQHAVGDRNDVRTFAQGIKNAKRMNTTHILIGETRDKESVEQMYAASNIGNCCYTTFHSNSVSSVFKGMGQLFDADQERMRVCEIIKDTALVVIQYLAKVGNKRVPIQEVLPMTREVKKRLLNTPYEDIYREIDKCVEEYGFSMQQDAKRALDNGEIDINTYNVVVSG